MLDDFVSHIVKGRFENHTFWIVNVASINIGGHVKTDSSSLIKRKQTLVYFSKLQN